ncbi:gustatory and pheromone receptor 32a-like, partial [Colias croceus]|uniref:gustatory and pheromone receptor 32a-like n=1 Tax=Colias crocea TaxID=72248 RepID=UPI001E27D173
IFAKIIYSRDVKIEDINKPIFLIASLVGLTPHSVKFSKSKQIFTVIPKSIYLNSLCSFTVMLILILFGFFHVRDVLFSAEKPQFNNEVTTQLNYILEFTNFDLFCTIAYVCAFINRARYVRILNMIVSTWKRIPSSKKSRLILEDLYLKRNLTLIGICLTIIAQLSINLSRKEGAWKRLLVIFTFNIPQTIQFILHALYTMLVITVTAILRNINAHCKFTDNEEHSKDSTFYEVKPKVKKMTLRQMELVYMRVFDMKIDINKTFEGPMLVSIMQSFHALVSEAHILYHGIVVDRDLTLHELFNCFSWISYQLIKLFSLAYSGSALKLEAIKTGQFLHCIPTENKDLRWLMEVQHFSTLLKYKSVEIDLYGFFPIDATLLFNIFASATMYLIILVQFDSRH